MPVVRTDGGRSVYGHVITKFSGMGRFTYHSAPLARERAPLKNWSFQVVVVQGQHRNVQKSVMRVQSCYFAHETCCFFLRSPCPRRRSFVRSVYLLLATAVFHQLKLAWKKYGYLLLRLFTNVLVSHCKIAETRFSGDSKQRNGLWKYKTVSILVLYPYDFSFVVKANYVLMYLHWWIWLSCSDAFSSSVYCFRHSSLIPGIKAPSTRIRLFLNPQFFLCGFKNFHVHT